MKTKNFSIMVTINRLTLKALLIDTVTALKFGQHLSPNYKSAKKQLCTLAGQKPNIDNKQFLHLIGLVYRDNGQEVDFWATIDKFKANKFLQ